MGLKEFLGLGGEDTNQTVVANKDPGQKGDGFFTDSNFYGALLNAGVGLAGVYFKQTGDKALAEQATKQRMAEIAAMAKKGGGGGGSGAALAIAKMNNLSAMYQNYAALTEKGGEAEAQMALETGRTATNAINQRSGRL